MNVADSHRAGDIIIGLVSDTHGLLRPSVLDALAGSTMVLHAGDVGGEGVLLALAAIAPVHAVSGNVDPAGSGSLRERIELEVGGLSLHVSHGHELGSPTPARLLRRYAADVIVYGHTHVALVHREGARLVINPGAAGPRRFKLEPSVARLTIARGRADVAIVPV